MEYAIIVASGKGTRMGSTTPKQFLPVAGLPIVMHTIRRFREYSPDIVIILVLPEDSDSYWQELCRQYNFSDPHLLTCTGGATRYHSVKNGLALVPAPDASASTPDIVGVQDGVRPLVSVEVIRRCYDAARQGLAVVPAIPVVETIRHIIQLPDNSETVPRNDYKLAQTPQVFTVAMLKEAYKQPYRDLFTDDASVVEAMGEKITLVEGNRENVKITTPIDMAIANALLTKE